MYIVNTAGEAICLLDHLINESKEFLKKRACSWQEREQNDLIAACQELKSFKKLQITRADCDWLIINDLIKLKPNKGMYEFRIKARYDASAIGSRIRAIVKPNRIRVGKLSTTKIEKWLDYAKRCIEIIKDSQEEFADNERKSRKKLKELVEECGFEIDPKEKKGSLRSEIATLIYEIDNKGFLQTDMRFHVFGVNHLELFAKLRNIV
ncbi:MAG TPA: hypothetical protein V6C96_01820 [Vampirovibrionales bacterium]